MRMPNRLTALFTCTLLTTAYFVCADAQAPAPAAQSFALSERVPFDAAVKLAELPDLVRGYEEIKLARVESYRQRLREAVAAFA